MDVIIGQRCLRAFASAIQCLSRIGKDLYIEADAAHLTLRALNDSKSAFSAFYLQQVSHRASCR
jgi:hypothetical protein